jgi:hypothetical protein
VIVHEYPFQLSKEDHPMGNLHAGKYRLELTLVF